jgi:hypothetical protein
MNPQTNDETNEVIVIHLKDGLCAFLILAFSVAVGVVL